MYAEKLIRPSIKAMNADVQICFPGQGYVIFPTSYQEFAEIDDFLQQFYPDEVRTPVEKTIVRSPISEWY